MISAWTKHLKTPEEKQAFEQQIRSCHIVFDRLQQLVKEADDNLSRAEASLEAYDKPNWDYRQAHANGYRSALTVFKQLIDLDHKDKK